VTVSLTLQHEEHAQRLVLELVAQLESKEDHSNGIPFKRHSIQTAVHSNGIPFKSHSIQTAFHSNGIPFKLHSIQTAFFDTTSRNTSLIAYK
jgi:hypothetical protein